VRGQGAEFGCAAQVAKCANETQSRRPRADRLVSGPIGVGGSAQALARRRLAPRGAYKLAAQVWLPLARSLLWPAESRWIGLSGSAAAAANDRAAAKGTPLSQLQHRVHCELDGDDGGDHLGRHHGGAAEHEG